MREHREFDESAEHDSDRLYSLEELMSETEVEEVGNKAKTMTEEERTELLQEIHGELLTEDERNELVRECISETSSNGIVIENQNLDYLADFDLESRTCCSVPIVGKQISDPQVVSRTSEILEIIGEHPSTHIELEPSSIHNNIARVVNDSKEAFSKVAEVLTTENRDIQGLESVRSRINEANLNDDKIVQFTIALSEIAFMSQQPPSLLSRIESLSVRGHEPFIDTDTVLSGSRLIVYASQLAECENGTTAGVEALRITTNAFLRECGANWTDFIRAGLNANEIIHLALASAYTLANKVEIREGGFFSISRKGKVITRANILLDTAIAILNTNENDRLKMKRIEEHYLSSTRVAADNIELECSFPDRVKYASMTHGFWRPQLKGGRHREGLKGKYYRSGIKVSLIDPEGETIQEEFRSSKVRKNLDLEECSNLIPFFSVIMEHDPKNNNWSPRKNAPIVYLRPSYSKVIGMKFDDIMPGSSLSNRYSDLIDLNIICLDNGFVTLHPQGFESATLSFNNGYEMNKVILGSILIPESVWEDGDEFLLSSVEKTINIDVFERYFKYLMNLPRQSLSPSESVQVDIHGFDYAIDSLEAENHDNILLWMKELRERNYFVIDGRSRLDTSPIKRKEFEKNLRDFAEHDMKRWRTINEKSKSLMKEGEDTFAIFCASHTGRLIPKVDWASSHPDNCPVFDRQSNNRKPSRTFNDFPNFKYAFASLGLESGTAKEGKSLSIREYPEMYVYYYRTKDTDNNSVILTLLSTVGADSSINDIFLATPEALTLAEAPIISSEVIDYLGKISNAISRGEEFRIPSTRKKGGGVTVFTFGEIPSSANNYRTRGILWGVGAHGSSPSTFRFQLNEMIQTMKELKVIASDLKIHPSSDKIQYAYETEKRFRKSYNMLLSMPFWKKDNEFDGISRSVVTGQMKTLATCIEKLLGLTSRRLGMGAVEQIAIGFNEVSTSAAYYGGGIPIPAKWDSRTRNGTFKHIASSHRLYFDELSSRNLVRHDTEFSSIWQSQDDAIWIPNLIAAPRAASYFDSRLASDERTLLKKIKRSPAGEKYIDSAFVIDIISKKNPQKSSGEKYLEIADETALVLSHTYTRNNAFYEFDTQTRNEGLVLEIPEIVALAAYNYANAMKHFKESGHASKGRGNQKAVYISETRGTWKYVIERCLPILEPSRIGSFLSEVDSLFTEGNISHSDAKSLSTRILQMTGQSERGFIVESMVSILRQQ